MKGKTGIITIDFYRLLLFILIQLERMGQGYLLQAKQYWNWYWNMQLEGRTKCTEKYNILVSMLVGKQ